MKERLTATRCLEAADFSANTKQKLKLVDRTVSFEDSVLLLRLTAGFVILVCGIILV